MHILPILRTPLLLLWLIILVGAPGCIFDTKGSEQSYADSPPTTIAKDTPWSERMALSIIHRNPSAWMIDFRSSPRWAYTNGLVTLSMQRLWQHNGDERYWNYAKAYADTMIDAKGTIRDYDITDFNIDNVNAGKILFLLFERSGDVRYQRAIETLRNQLRWQPRTTDGGFWHKLRYPWQMWLDGLYMGSPFLAEYGARFEEPEAIDDVVQQITLMEAHARDEKSGLLLHGWDESRLQGWSDEKTGLSENVWGRAMGWYAMALVDALPHLPETHPAHAEVKAILQRLVDSILPYQSKHGLWYQVINLPDAKGNYEEATVSCMFAYVLAKGVNEGYLDASYMTPAKKAYQGILTHLVKVDQHGIMSLEKCCAVAGLGGEPYRDGTFQYYINEEIRANDPKGTGPFVLASLEFERQGMKFSQ